MRPAISLALISLTLAGCQTAAPIVRPSCPTPPGELLVEPPKAPKIEAKGGRLTLQNAISIWLNEKELYRVQTDKFSRLQKWGRTQCEWGAPPKGKLQGN